jgi:hypothetical protein
VSEEHEPQTASTHVQQPRSRVPDRFEALGYKAPRRKPEGGPKELTARHLLLIEYMTYGVEHDFVRKMTRPVQQAEESGKIVTLHKPIEPGEPLTLIEAADLLRIRRRNARELATFPIFQRAYATELQRLRDGEKARSLHVMVEVRDEKGAGKAADQTVRLKAARAILGEGEGNRGTTVNVNTNVGVSVKAGLVLRLPADAPTIPLEHEDSDTSQLGRGK